MSVFGGDSWAREAQYRKRRVDELLIDGIEASSYKKLPSGKYACLVCPQNPIFGTPLMLSMHAKGSRHQTGKSMLKERELQREYEINKRIALSESSTGTSNTSKSTQLCRVACKPLLERTRRPVSEILCSENAQKGVVYETYDAISSWNHPHPTSGSSTCNEQVKQQQSDFRERQERELKFTAAGWKRDCHGRWFRDENVEFDSDEEDPNVSLA